MESVPDKRGGPTFIGGTHGSPSVTIALPFSTITRTDSELRGAVAELATLVAQLAAAFMSGDTAQIGIVSAAAEDLAARVSSAH
jgi:hypothetical protein